MITIDKILNRIPEQGRTTRVEFLMRDCGYPNMAMFKEDLLKYLKRKCKKFTLTDTELTIDAYTVADIPDLFRYFNLRYTPEDLKVGADMKHIYVKTLYNCWNEKDYKTYNDFINALNKYVANVIGEDNAFIFSNELTVKPYLEKKEELGVSLM